MVARDQAIDPGLVEKDYWIMHGLWGLQQLDFAFELKGGRPAGKRFIESLRVFSHLANVGDAKSLVIHPASTTHYRMSDEDLARAGIGPGTVRLSIGLEDPEDLVEDLARALRAAQK